MSPHPATYPILLNGGPVGTADLAPLAFSGFAHFTAMQVRQRRVKGLDLHLTRLSNASIELFGRAPSDETVMRSLWRAIEDGPPNQSLTVTAFPPEGEFTVGSREVEPGLLVRTGPPSNGPKGPLRLGVVEHERHYPTIKHVGEGAKTYYLRKAVEQGFDDAAFVDRQGRLSEATIWNLAFWDGHAVVWPRAQMLPGTMMRMIQRQLDGLGIAQRHEDVGVADVAGFEGAVVMNSWTPGVAVTAIGPAGIPQAPAFMDLLHAAFEAEPAWGAADARRAVR
ncbi:aminotransferase class IV family protein [Chitiniphilus purpureus]|uniref:Aminotransferase class IV family protein n=1 Tax=Chitiniphilus purpureus TaxID=2981137 RepID=A0ABY6DRW8_9NEIS|nr:aminotransferase class IV family protein [Chitiniphilus sp. CD1]UXY15831.1 aminotransferase class IV family protein [Chitiniphilus sp. CD1]